MFTKLHHVCIAVKDMEKALETFKKLLDLKDEEIWVSSEWYDGTVGDKMIYAYLHRNGTILELIQPITQGGNMDRFIQKYGEGIHHLAFESNDVFKDFEGVKSLGYKVIGDKLVEDVDGINFQFIHPGSVHGALIEVVQKHRLEGGNLIVSPPKSSD